MLISRKEIPQMVIGLLIALFVLLVILDSREASSTGDQQITMGGRRYYVYMAKRGIRDLSVEIAPAEERLSLLYHRYPRRRFRATVVFSEALSLDDPALASEDVYGKIHQVFLTDRVYAKGEEPDTQREHSDVYALEVSARAEQLYEMAENPSVHLVDPHWIDNPLEYMIRERTVLVRFVSLPACRLTE